MEKTLIATIKEKSNGKLTGREWKAYRLEDGRVEYVSNYGKIVFAEEVISSDGKKKYTVYSNARIAIGCTCKSRQFGKGKACKHMMAKTKQLKPAPAPAPVVEKKPAKKTEEPVRGTLNGQQGFSLMKRAS